MEKMKLLNKYCTIAGLAVVLALSKAIPALAEDFSVGVEGGWETSLAGKRFLRKDITDDRTRLNDTVAYGANATYRLPAGPTIGLMLDAYTARLKDKESDGDISKLGRVTAVPLMLTLGYQFKPDGAGFGTHAFIGAGESFNHFKRTSELQDEGIKVNLRNSFVWGLGIGEDYFFNKNLSVGLDGRFLFSRARVRTKQEDGSTNSIFGSGTNKGHADLNSFQALLGVKYWF